MPANGEVTIVDVYNLIERFRKEVKDTYVTKTEFKPVRVLVYGLVGLILMAVGGALVAQVVQAGI